MAEILLEAGGLLPEMQLSVTAEHIISGASASRDWQVQHHDRAEAKAMGLPDVIMNTPTQAGHIGRYITELFGKRARITSIRFRMNRPITPGDSITFSGSIRHACPTNDMTHLILDVDLNRDGRPVTVACLCITVPTTDQASSPWKTDLPRKVFQAPDFK